MIKAIEIKYSVTEIRTKLPCDSEADEAANLPIAVAGRAGDATLGVALEAVLATVAVSGGLAVEAVLLVPGRVRVPAVTVARQAPRLGGLCTVREVTRAVCKVKKVKGL